MMMPPATHRLLCGWLLLAAVTGCGGPVQRNLEAERAALATADLETAVFAAGCFWCVEEAFDAAPGVVATESGFIGGHLADPSYRQVVSGGTGHTEAVKVSYDPRQVDYASLLEVFWRNVDPTDAKGQFCDRGPSYRGGIFYSDAEQEALARASKQALIDAPDAPKPIVTEITAASEFYPAEDYHQNYYQRNPLRYSYYKTSCGRTARLEELWGPAA